MAFNFSWNDFSTAFVKQSEGLLTAALNKGVKPSIIADNITVKELNMGSTVGAHRGVMKVLLILIAARVGTCRTRRLG